MGAPPNSVSLIERLIEMFLETEITKTLTALEFLLAMLIGMAPIVVTLWVKLVLYRRRMAEDNDEASRLQNEREATQARERLQGRYADMVRALPPDFRPSRPLGLYVSPQPIGPRATADANSENSHTEPALK